MTGFGIRIYPSGKRSFVISYSTRSGRDRIQILGQVGRLTLDKAERLARQVFADVAEGRDPPAERRAPAGRRSRPPPSSTSTSGT
jgi:hypothetical protein